MQDSNPIFISTHFARITQKLQRLKGQTFVFSQVSLKWVSFQKILGYTKIATVLFFNGFVCSYVKMKMSGTYTGVLLALASTEKNKLIEHLKTIIIFSIN